MHLLAICAKELDIPMIYISTDYVFDGRKGIQNIDIIEYIRNYGIENLKEKYIPQKENETPNPINLYGKIKLEGATYVRKILDRYYIVCISWAFGQNGNDFIDTMLRLQKIKMS